MMVKRRPLLIVAALAATLWVVPSIGTQGMGTMGQRFVHVDRALADDTAGAAALRIADARVAAALAR